MRLQRYTYLVKRTQRATGARMRTTRKLRIIELCSACTMRPLCMCLRRGYFGSFQFGELTGTPLCCGSFVVEGCGLARSQCHVLPYSVRAKAFTKLGMRMPPLSSDLLGRGGRVHQGGAGACARRLQRAHKAQPLAVDCFLIETHFVL